MLHDCSTLENWSKNVTLVDLGKEGNIINDGYNEEVDKLRRAKSDGKDLSLIHI